MHPTLDKERIAIVLFELEKKKKKFHIDFEIEFLILLIKKMVQLYIFEYKIDDLHEINPRYNLRKIFDFELQLRFENVKFTSYKIKCNLSN